VSWIEWPAQLLAWIDLQLAGVLGPLARLVVWSALGGALTMLLYGLLSPQRRIAQTRRELTRARQRLDRFDGDLHNALPLMRGMLASAFRQLGLVAAPALAALLPMILLAAWMAHTYGYDYPLREQPVSVRTVPSPVQAQWLHAEDGARPPRVVLRDEAGRALGEVAVSAPVPVIAKRSAWAALAGSPLGFLPDEFPVERIEIALPRRELIGWGPSWMRSWEFVFFGVLTVVALGLKRVLRLQ
jgi:hypothetical protein